MTKQPFWWTGIVLFGALLVVPSWGQAQQRAPRSIEVRRVLEAESGRMAAADGNLGTPVLVRFDLLEEVARAGGIVELPLGPITVRAQVDWTSGGDASQTFVAGPLVGQEGEVSLTIVDGTMSARIVVGERVFMIRRAAGSALHVVTEVDPDAFPPESQPLLVPEPPPGARLFAPLADDPVGDTNEFVDVMLVYTAAARDYLDGTTPTIVAELVGAINHANTALANAAVTHRFRLVHTAEVVYTEDASASVDLSRLTGTSDGFMDTVHTLRNTYAADVVSLVVRTPTPCGVGWLLTSPGNSAFQSNAFNVVDISCANANLTLAHEIGHNMGLHHDRANAGGGQGAFPYAYGWGIFGVGRSVMAYTCLGGSGTSCIRRAIFSNPDRNFPPALTTPSGSVNDNNALALNGTSLTVANFRQSAGCSFGLTPASASFGQAGGPGSLAVTTGSACVWTITETDPQSFLTLTSAASGTGSTTVSFSVAANGGALRTGSFTIGGQTFTVTQGPTITTDRTTLSYGAVNAGGTLTNQTSAQIIRVGAGAGLSWTATPSAPWIQVTGGSGTGAGQFTVSVVGHASLPATGTVTSSVLVTSAGASNSPRTATVRLTLFANTTTTTAPNGSFDTPVHLSTGLQGSLAVTGWAVDDTEVVRVSIWRDLAAGEPAGNATGTGLAAGKVFIGDALFVTGARPDVEAAYPTTPLAYRAGWGYLMLTWGLWGQGNGTYILYAFAHDNDAHVFALGAKTISVSNTQATRPFGAIDTPGYGGTASGAGFVNFGWALTPPANTTDLRNCVINSNGVQVSVDSGPLQPVTYGSNRPDIQAGFPTFSNAAGAGGHSIFNAAALANGVHTIGWLATDSCGRADGLGSRFFTVTGSATDAPTLTGTATLTEVTGAPVGIEAAGAPTLSNAPVRARRNTDPWAPVPVTPSGANVVTLAQGERVEVQVGVGRTGRQVVNGRGRPLPVGSSYDAAEGIFYWQPAEGFLGGFDLEFAPAGSAVQSAAGVVPLRVVVGPPMRMAIDTPQHGEVVPPSFLIAGWALDLAATDGPGVDTVHVWAYPTAGGAPVFLGVPVVGGARPDVAVTYGAAFTASAYDLQTTPLPPGAYDVVVYVHRTATNAFDAAHVVRVMVGR